MSHEQTDMPILDYYSFFELMVCTSSSLFALTHAKQFFVAINYKQIYSDLFDKVKDRRGRVDIIGNIFFVFVAMEEPGSLKELWMYKLSRIKKSFQISKFLNLATLFKPPNSIRK